MELTVEFTRQQASQPASQPVSQPAKPTARKPASQKSQSVEAWSVDSTLVPRHPNHNCTCPFNFPTRETISKLVFGSHIHLKYKRNSSAILSDFHTNEYFVYGQFRILDFATFVHRKQQHRQIWRMEETRAETDSGSPSASVAN